MERETSSGVFCNEDRISDLPEPISASILCKVPIKEAARTSIISTKWRYLWNSIPHLDLDERLASRDRETGKIKEWVRVVYRILLFRRAPIQKCKISIDFSPNYVSDFDTFFISLARSGIQHLSFWNENDAVHCCLPGSLFYSHNSLSSPSIVDCELEPPPSFKTMSHLKTIDFQYVTLTDDLIEKLISSCVILDSLIHLCEGIKNLKIRAPHLSFLYVVSTTPLNIFLTDATTSLVFVFLSFSSFKVSEDEANNFFLFLRNLTSLERLEIWCSQTFNFPKTFIEGHLGTFPSKNLPNLFLNLKKLITEINFNNETDVAFLTCLLRHSPYLQDVFIQAFPFTLTDVMVIEQGYWERQTPFQCLTHNLKTVGIGSLDLRRDNDVGFVTYLLMHACVLETITVEYFQELISVEERSRVIEKFRDVERASAYSLMIVRPSILPIEALSIDI